MVRFSALLATILGVAATAAGAGAATIHHGCGNDVCRIAPDGSGQSVVASGRPYGGPSVAFDGQHVAWIEPTADLFTGTPGGAPLVLTRHVTLQLR